MPSQMARGPAGGHGRPVHQGGRQGREPAIILHLIWEELPAWALLHRRSAAKNMLFLQPQDGPDGTRARIKEPSMIPCLCQASLYYQPQE